MADCYISIDDCSKALHEIDASIVLYIFVGTENVHSSIQCIETNFFVVSRFFIPEKTVSTVSVRKANEIFRKMSVH